MNRSVENQQPVLVDRVKGLPVLGNKSNIGNGVQILGYSEKNDGWVHTFDLRVGAEYDIVIRDGSAGEFRVPVIVSSTRTPDHERTAQVYFRAKFQVRPPKPAPQELTIAQVEARLGYPVKIVKE